MLVLLCAEAFVAPPGPHMRPMRPSFVFLIITVSGLDQKRDPDCEPQRSSPGE